jgi:drug/metabolite transporter (DMT)-like permease
MTRKSWGLFLAAGVLWGVPYLFIKIAVEPGGFQPGFLVFARVCLGALFLLPLAMKQGLLPEALKYAKWILLYSVIELVGPWYFLSSGERHVSSGLAGLLIATVPFWSTILASLLGDHSVWQPRRIAGMVIGFIGVFLVVGLESLRGENSGSAIAMIVLAAVGYAIAPMMIRRKAPTLNGLAINSLAMLFTAIIYIPVGIIQFPATMPSAKAIWSLVILGIFPTAIAFVVFFKVIVDVGPTRASMVTYINTAVAVLLGIVVLNEPLTLGIGLGLPLILIGSYLSGKKSVTQ